MSQHETYKELSKKKGWTKGKDLQCCIKNSNVPVTVFLKKLRKSGMVYRKTKKCKFNSRGTNFLKDVFIYKVVPKNKTIIYDDENDKVIDKVKIKQ